MVWVAYRLAQPRLHAYGDTYAAQRGRNLIRQHGCITPQLMHHEVYVLHERTCLSRACHRQEYPFVLLYYTIEWLFIQSMFMQKNAALGGKQSGMVER